MRSERFYAGVGLFVTGAFILVVLISIFFYEQFSGAQKHTFVMFFRGSLKGLETSTPVTYRGVKIGKVTLIEVTENRAGNKVMIPVYVEFSVEKTLGVKQDPILFLIDNSYIGEISKPNFLTGVADIEITLPKNPIVPHKQGYFRGYPVFPTRDTVQKYTSLDEALKSADKMFKSIRELAKSNEIKQTIIAAKEMALATKEMADSIDKLVGNLDKNLPNVASYLTQSLRKISDAATSIETLTNYLSRNPEALLRGKQ